MHSTTPFTAEILTLFVDFQISPNLVTKKRLEDVGKNKEKKEEDIKLLPSQKFTLNLLRVDVLVERSEFEAAANIINDLESATETVTPTLKKRLAVAKATYQLALEDVACLGIAKKTFKKYINDKNFPVKRQAITGMINSLLLSEGAKEVDKLFLPWFSSARLGQSLFPVFASDDCF